MRLNYSTYPVFKYIDKPNLSDMIFGMPIDNAVLSRVVAAKQPMDEFVAGLFQVAIQAKHRWYITNTFHEAVKKAAHKMEDNFSEIISPSCGILFTDKGFTLYMINPQKANEESKQKVRLILYGFTRTGLTCFAFEREDGAIFGSYFDTQEDGTQGEDPIKMYAWTRSIKQVLYFIEFCEIEQKEIKPNQKVKLGPVKHYNESAKNYTVLDCKWFTDLIHTMPFSVSGHLRWQACGPMHTKRKLIYVEGYQKRIKREAKKKTFTP